MAQLISTQELDAIENMVSYYLLRQQIIVDIMLEYHTELMQKQGFETFLGIDLTTKVEYWREHYLGQVPQLGTWQKEWNYILHGHGCKITHQDTKEILDWDAGHPKSFVLEYFHQHALWRVSFHQDNPDVLLYKQLQSRISDIFSYLMEIRVLIPIPESRLHFFVR